METKRLIPEVISFLSSVIVLYLPKFSKYWPDMQKSSLAEENLLNNIYYNKEFYSQFKHHLLNNIKYSNFNDLRTLLSQHTLNAKDRKSKDTDKCSKVLESISFQWSHFSRSSSDGNDQSNLVESILSMTYKLILKGLIPLYSGYSAFPELMYPISQLLPRILPHQEPVLSYNIQLLHCEILESFQKLIPKVLAERIPLQWREKHTSVVDSKTPKYHINYVIKRDREEYDNENKEKSQLKQLNRQLKREQKAAMRELRRDADFIEQEAYKEKQAKLEQQRNERIRNFSWLEEQQATINQQVKQGKGLMKGGGSFVAKKPRVKR